MSKFNVGDLVKPREEMIEDPSLEMSARVLDSESGYVLVRWEDIPLTGIGSVSVVDEDDLEADV